MLKICSPQLSGSHSDAYHPPVFLTNSSFYREIVQDAFYRGLGHAIQWYDSSVLCLAPHTPGGLQVVLVDLVDSIWSPPGFHKNSHITTELCGVHLEFTGVHLDSNWTPHEPH